MRPGIRLTIIARMNIRGVSILSRKKMIEREHGDAAWAKVNARLVERAPFFRTPILQVTTVPIEAFLAFNEVVVEVLYGGRAQGYWELGEKAGYWSATEGPSRHFSSRGPEVYLRGIGGIWNAHYDGGELAVELIPGGAKLFVRKVPKHPFFEAGALGFVLGGLKVAGARNVRPRCIRGFSKGDPDVEYEVLFS